VVDYLARQDFVDSDRIAVLELCGGGGYAAAATLRNHRIKALATVSMVDNGTSTRLGWYEIKTHLQCWSLSRLLHRSSRLEQKLCIS
jgi:dienelactone hydrolase